MERIVTLTDKTNIYARIFEPGEPETGVSIVIANSLFSENKYSRNFLINNARQLCGLGYQVLFFDYRGMAESKGQSSSMNMESMSEDIRTAISYIRSESVKHIVLIGFRGGAIPVLSLAQDTSIGLVVLWEPVKKGSELIRFRNLIPMKERSFSSENNSSEADRNINIGGWDINPGFCEELKHWKLDEQIRTLNTDKLYGVNFGPAAKTAPKNTSADNYSVGCVDSDKFWHFGSSQLLLTPVELTDTRIRKML